MNFLSRTHTHTHSPKFARGQSDLISGLTASNIPPLSFFLSLYLSLCSLFFFPNLSCSFAYRYLCLLSIHSTAHLMHRHTRTHTHAHALILHVTSAFFPIPSFCILRYHQLSHPLLNLRLPFFSLPLSEELLANSTRAMEMSVVCWLSGGQCVSG